VAQEARPAGAQRAGRPSRAAAPGSGRHGEGFAAGAGERAGGPGRRGRLGPGQVPALRSYFQRGVRGEAHASVRRSATERCSPVAEQQETVNLVRFRHRHRRHNNRIIIFVIIIN